MNRNWILKLTGAGLLAGCLVCGIPARADENTVIERQTVIHGDDADRTIVKKDLSTDATESKKVVKTETNADGSQSKEIFKKQLNADGTETKKKIEKESSADGSTVKKTVEKTEELPHE